MSFDDRIARELDAWWDDELTGRSHPEPDEIIASEIAVVSDLHTRNAPAIPPPAFVQSLRGTLMNQAWQSSTVHSFPSSMLTVQTRARDTARIGGASTRAPHRGVAFIRVAVAAIFLIGAIGAAYGSGLFDRASNRERTPIPAAVSQDEGATPTPAASRSVANYRGDAARTGQMPGPAPAGAPTLVWKSSAGGTNPSIPAIDDGKVFILVYNDDPAARFPYLLKAFEIGTGADLWSVGVDASSSTDSMAPVAADGLVYVVTTAGIVALDQSDGDVAWGYTAGATRGFGPPPALDHGMLYLEAGDGTLRAVEAKTGAETWNVAIPGATADNAQYETHNSEAALAISSGVIFGVGLDGIVFAADATNGRILWTFTADGWITRSPVVANGAVYVASTIPGEGPAGTPGRLYALDAKTGDPIREPKVLGSSFEVTAGEGRLFLSSATPYGIPLTAIDAASGEELWTRPDVGARFSPVYADGTLFTEGSDGSVLQIDPASGEVLWSVFLNWVVDPVVVDGLLIASGYDSIFAIGGDGNAAAAQTVDFSGLPACTPPGPVPGAEYTGTAARTIGVETRLEERPSPPTYEDGRPASRTEWPQLLRENVPVGPSASAAQTNEIQETLRAMGNCYVRTDGETLIQGFFTSDFFRRGVVSFDAFGYHLTWAIQPEETEIVSLTTVVLSDGRIAARIAPIHNPEELIIFTQRNGHWMIDELCILVDEYNFGPLG